MKFVTVCSDKAGRVKLALAEDGMLWKAKLRRAGREIPQGAAGAGGGPKPDDGNQKTVEEEWEPVDFNGMYDGYYTPCHFTALLATKAEFVAAGTGADGLPYVCRSLQGGVWDQAALVGKTPMAGVVQAQGRVNAMLFEPVTSQIFLLCDNGELVTLPDCPKCVRIQKVADQAIVSGEVCGKELMLRLADGTELHVGVSNVVQYRVSYSYAAGYLKSHGGMIVWLGQGKPEFGQVTGPEAPEGIRTVCIPPDDVTDWLREELERGGKERFVAFWCDYGVQADAAAAAARGMGYEKAYSLGGEREYLHVV